MKNTNPSILQRPSFLERLRRDFQRNYPIYLMVLPVVIWFALFCYAPMYGVTMAFKDFKPRKGLLASDWVGFKHFIEFFDSYYFWRLIRNTFLISFYGLIFGFPIPIIFAILLNEVRNTTYKKTIQTVTYLPHFITTVVICSLILQFTGDRGFLTTLFNTLTGHTGPLINEAKYFRTIYTVSGIWQGFGWGSIIYLAAITGVNPDLYEAAIIDGANKFKQIIHITIPGIMPTIVIMFIMNCGSLLSVGWEKVFLLQSPLTYETSDVISTYVYRKGFEDMDYSFSAAVGLFSSVINIIMLTIANQISRKVTETSLW